MTSRLVTDAQTVSGGWLDELDMTTLLRDQLASYLEARQRIDLIAIGKASKEMARCAEQILGSRVHRRLIVSDRDDAVEALDDPGVLSGEHPIPGPASLHAARALVEFLDAESHGDATLFLISGGASSLCAWPSPPLTLEDLAGLWHAALESGVDITTLNMARAATSNIAGGAILRHVRSATSRSLIMVDNVVSGAPWVASGLTYRYEPSPAQLDSLLRDLGLSNAPLGDSLRSAHAYRSRQVSEPISTLHENVVVASPDLMHQLAVADARRLGYRVIDKGSHVHGDVARVSAEWTTTLRRLAHDDVPTCILGTGEVTVRVNGSGNGGRCQEFAWLMARQLASFDREAVFAARASDGRDYLAGVAGAWVDRTTVQRAESVGLQWSEIASSHDSHRGLAALHQLFEGRHTGWNLCDLYLLVTR
ncbi:MAG: DUF4147 domain-containing protein [Acidimicrobiales bacterium]